MAPHHLDYPKPTGEKEGVETHGGSSVCTLEPVGPLASASASSSQQGPGDFPDGVGSVVPATASLPEHGRQGNARAASLLPARVMNFTTHQFHSTGGLGPCPPQKSGQIKDP